MAISFQQCISAGLLHLLLLTSVVCFAAPTSQITCLPPCTSWQTNTTAREVCSGLDMMLKMNTALLTTLQPTTNVSDMSVYTAQLKAGLFSDHDYHTPIQKSTYCIVLGSVFTLKTSYTYIWKDLYISMLLTYLHRQIQNYSLCRTSFALHTTATSCSHQCSRSTTPTTLNMQILVDCRSFPGRHSITHAIGSVHLS